MDKVEGIDIETMTAEAYADDLTILFQMSVEGMRSILTILNDFEKVTGLGINANKTQLMVCGTEDWLVGNTVEGITIVEKITVLGMDIDRKLEQLDVNWDRAILKMKRQCGLWGGFGLSIGGRAMAVKTYILSQTIYLMGVLPLSPEKGGEINDVMVNFIKGRDRVIENRRKMLCEDLGGYGIIDANIMNKSIKCAWIKRWQNETVMMDYPRTLVLKEVEANLDRVQNSRGENGRGILGGIVDCWMEFKKKYYECGENYKYATLFGNSALDPEGNGIEEGIFGRVRYREMRAQLQEVRLGDVIYDNGAIKGRNQLNRMLEVNINWAEYFRLREIMERLWNQYQGNKDQLEGKSLNEFVSGTKKGCKNLGT